jgi:hypothetical protein
MVVSFSRARSLAMVASAFNLKITAGAVTVRQLDPDAERGRRLAATALAERRRHRRIASPFPAVQHRCFRRDRTQAAEAASIAIVAETTMWSGEAAP